MPVQRSLRDLPIVKVDVLDPSLFCGESTEEDNKFDDAYMASARSDSCGYAGGSIQSSLYKTVATNERPGSGSLEGTLPVARVVPFPKPPRRPSGQIAVRQPVNHKRSTASYGSQNYAQSTRRNRPPDAATRHCFPDNQTGRRATTRTQLPSHQNEHNQIRANHTLPSTSFSRVDLGELNPNSSIDEDECDSSKYQGIYSKVDDGDDDEEVNVVKPKSDRAYDVKIIYYSGHKDKSRPRSDHYEIPVKVNRPSKPNPPPRPVLTTPINTLPRNIAPPLPPQRSLFRPVNDRSSYWSTHTEWDPDDVEDTQDPAENENEYMEIRDDVTDSDTIITP